MTTYPPSTAADARNRAFRTFVQGLLVDVVLAVTAALSLALSSPEFDWSRPFWIGVGLTLAKTALTTITAYIMRKAAPPAV